MEYIGLDTETTGVDLYSGCMPYLVTTYKEGDDAAVYWEWDVDPLTRRPIIPKSDLKEIKDYLRYKKNRRLILQNGKFDMTALSTLPITWDFEKLWSMVRDTLIAGHLIHSNSPHDLTSMVLVHLGINIQPYELALEKACQEARRIAKRDYPDWRIAQEGLPEMPSAKGKDKKKEARGAEKSSLWKNDAWLPRAIAKEKGYPKDHPWWTVLSDYANTDSISTVKLYLEQQKIIKSKGLWKIYAERLKCLPIAHHMERKGVTVNRQRIVSLTEQYREESDKAGRVCVNIAKSYGYDLTLPKSSNNKSLLDFVFKVMGLEPVELTDNGAPSLNKVAIEKYRVILNQRSKPYHFLQNLSEKRSRDTACIYMNNYAKFWQPTGICNEDGEQLWFRLHPSLNPTGTDTLRWSSNNPNEQNISKKEGFNLRYGFGPAPDREWWSLDGQNLELRIPAYHAGEDEMIALFEEPDKPPYYGSNHLLNFHTVYEDIWEKELKEHGFEKVASVIKNKYKPTWYQRVKMGGFAVQYGAVLLEDKEGTADRAFGRPGSHAKIKDRFKKIHGPGGLNERLIKQAEDVGYVETLPDKSVDPTRGYPLFCGRSQWGRIRPTVPLNYVVQGTACWWMMRAMHRCHEYLEEEYNRGKPPDKQAFITMQIHDELVFDFPRGKGKEPWKTNLPHIKKISQLMEQGGKDIGVPTPTSITYHPDNWSEGVDL